MKHIVNTTGPASRIGIVTVPLLVAVSGTASAHGGGSYGGSMRGGWGLIDGAMGLWGFLWMGLLIAVPIFLVYSLRNRGANGSDERPLLLRERYARGELSEEEFERRRERLERA